MIKKAASAILVMALMAFFVSCSSPAEKRAKFYDRGKTLYEKGDYVRASLEFKNALQIDPNFADAYQMLGQVALKEKKFKQAFGSFSKAVELNPDLLDAQVELARIFMAARSTDRAQEKVDQILAKNPDNSGAQLIQAAIYSKAKNLDGAESILSDLYQKGETSGEMYLMLASIYDARKDTANAEAMLREGIQKNPDAMTLRIILANFYQKADKPEAAEALLRENIEIQPDVAGHRLALANFYWNAENTEKALGVLKDLARLETNREKNIITAAQFLLKQKDADQAETMLRQGIADAPKSFALREALTDLFLLKKEPGKAMDVLTKSLSLSSDPADPGILAVKTKMARIHLLQREPNAAEALVDAVLKENAKSIEANFIKGQLHLLAGRPAEAVTAFRTVVAEAPDNVKGHLLLGQAHLMNKEIALAIDILNQGVRQNPASREIRRALARLYMANKDKSAAAEQLVKIAEIDPTDIRAMGDLGDFKLAQEAYDEAKIQYERMVNTHPEVPAGYLKLAHLHEVKGDRDGAVDILEKGYAKNSDSMPLLAGLVKAYLLVDKADMAKKYCKEKIAAYPDNAFTYNLLAQVHIVDKNPGLAEDALKAAIARAPQWNVPHENLAKLYLSQGKTQQAIANLENAIQKNNKNSGAVMTLALLYQKDGQLDKARAVYEKTLETAPRSWAAANNLAFLLADATGTEADLDRALELARQAEKIKPDEATIKDTLGWIHHKRGDDELAVAVLEEALEKFPDSGVINYHLAQVLADNDRLDEAREKLEQALAADENYPERSRAEALLKSIQGT